MGIEIRAKTWHVWLLSLLGAAALGLGVTLPGFLKAPVPGFLLMGLPLCLGGLVCLLHGLALAGCHFRVDADGLKAMAPAWRGFPCPPVRRLEVRPGQIRAVSRREVRYTMGGVTLLNVALWRLETEGGGGAVFSETGLPGLAEAMTRLAETAGLPVSRPGTAQQGIFAALAGRPPGQDQA